MDIEERVITITADRSKNATAFRVPMSRRAHAAIAEAMELHDRPFIFSTTGGEKPVLPNTKQAHQWTSLASVENFNPHDCRRVIRTALEDAGVPENVCEALIGHKRNGIAGVYSNAELMEPKRGAIVRWDAMLDVWLGEATNVIALAG